MEGEIILKKRIPSPHPKILLFEVTYVSQGLKVKGLLAEPQWAEQFPGFLYLRGGIKNVGMVRIARIIQFASEGFVVMAPYYRGNKGGEGREDFAGEDRNDAYSAFQLLEVHPKVITSQIHVFGFSRGGVMALFTGMKFPIIQSVVCWGGVSDMFLCYEERVDLRKMLKRVIGGTPNKMKDQYEWRTPLQNIEEITMPVLLIHGAKDKNVSVEHTYRLEKALNENGKDVTTWIFEDYDHFFPLAENRKVVEELCEWLRKGNL
ncbi:alpha/beta hydrolase family protein [Anaerobacillus sp. MEB173]|uniref:alpha/beta hydrolase family protein n=1 Tax=Anaerobacillus sp. MEB173 TaxID=3383345 RepID=UPI003F93625B